MALEHFLKEIALAVTLPPKNQFTICNLKFEILTRFLAMQKLNKIYFISILLMKITIKATKIKLTPEIKEFVEEQINSLEKFVKGTFGEKYYDGFFGKGKPKAEARVEIKGKERGFYYVECNLNFPKKLIRSESLKKNLKSAIYEVKDELQREIKEYKEKFFAKYERGARKWKRELKISEAAKIKEGKRVLREGI
jgi:ribosomal subunit interface protein